MDILKLYVYDIETYSDLFSFSIVRADGKHKKTWECSSFKNEIEGVFTCLDFLHENDCYLVGFNSVNFDWPVVQSIVNKRKSLPKTGKGICNFVFGLAQKQIDSFKNSPFGNSVPVDEEYVRQIDLFKVHHFDNKAKMTSLKLIEFNLKMQTIIDLPYGIEETLTEKMISEIKIYNEHDVEATRLFLQKSLAQVDFRFQLTEKYSKDFLNHNDGKIGKDYFKMKLDECGVRSHVFKNGKKVLNQTLRSSIPVKDCLFDYYDFKRPEFACIKTWFEQQTITETKGVFSDIEEHLLGDVAKYCLLETKRKKFKGEPDESVINEFKREHPMGWVEIEELKATEYALNPDGTHIMEYVLDADGSPDLSKKQKKKRIPKKSYWGCYRIAETLHVIIDGLRIDFGVGGIHASLVNKIAIETRKYLIRDADCSSMYPNIAISNNVYPHHLGLDFCVIYKDVYEQRKSYPKSSAENGMLKLALNSVYGDSNNKYSSFYDPMYTMKITLNGQLSLFLLAEKLLCIDGLKLVQLNTDGLTVALPRDKEQEYAEVCQKWEKQVGLQLEYADYSKMIIRDVNNYIAVYTNGKLKRKGAYQYEGLGWHQNQGGLIIPMAAEAEMLKGIPARKFIEDHLKNPDNKWDFLLRTKVPRSSHLMLVFPDGTEVKQQNVCRYYISNTGGNLVKVMPPLEGDTEDRKLGIDVGWNVTTCNEVPDELSDVCLEYYVSEAEKLIIRKVS